MMSAGPCPPITWIMRAHVAEPHTHNLLKINSFVDTGGRIVDHSPLAPFVISKFDSRVQKLQVVLGGLL